MMSEKRIIAALEHGPKSAIEICRFHAPKTQIVNIERARMVRESCLKLIEKGVIRIIPAHATPQNKRIYPAYEMVTVLTGLMAV